MHNDILNIIVGVIIFASCVGLAIGIDYVYGASSITIDNSGRHEYGYCPIAPETMLSRAEFEINGCPIVRVYISNWNQLSITDQTTIDTQLRTLGFKDIGELDSRVK